MQSAIYTNILEDIKKGDAILEATDRIYRTDDAAIYSGYANTSNVFNIQTKDADKILLPSESMLRVVFSLANAAGNGPYGPYDTLDATGAPNNLPIRIDPASISAGVATLIAGGLHLFDQARLIIDNNQVELVNKPGFAHIVEHLLTSSIDHIKASNENEWLWLDDGGVTTGTFVVGNTGADQDNTNTYVWTGTAAEVDEVYGMADPRKYLPDNANGTGAGGYNPKYNHGFAMRWLRTQTKLNALVFPHVAANDTSVDVELAIPISRVFGYFADIRCAYSGIKFEIELTKNTNYTEIVHGRGAVFAAADLLAAEPATVVIKRIEWAIPTVIPSTSVLEVMRSDLSSGRSASKVFASTQVYINNYSVGLPQAPATTIIQDIDWRIQTTGKKISRVVIGFQRGDQYRVQNDPDNPDTDDLHNNGGLFSHLVDITKIELRLGSLILPRESYNRMSFAAAAPNVARNYADFLQAGGRLYADDGGVVTYDKFKEIYPLFAFDLSRSSIDQDKFTSQDLRLISAVEVAPNPYYDPNVSAGPTNSDFRVVALITYEYDVEFAGIDGRIAIKLP